MKPWLVLVLSIGLYGTPALGLSPDFDGSGKVDYDDFFLYVDHFGAFADGTTRIFDLSQDGRINYDDFFLFVDHFGETRDFRQEMRDFIQALSAWARGSRPGTGAGFFAITQNGQELLTLDGEPDGPLARVYAAAVSGVGQEELFYGYDGDNLPTPVDEREWLVGFLERWKANGAEVLVTDYCSNRGKADDSYARNAGLGYLSFAADRRELDHVPAYPPKPHNVHAGDLHTLAEARNFLYLIDPQPFPSRETYLATLAATDYDLLLIDAFFDEDPLTPAEVARLKTKANGGDRLVVAYLSIGEAEDYRYYWRASWTQAPPSWLAAENPDWPGNFKVRYWNPEWQAIVFGTPDSYLGRILAAGFDGVYLDVVEAFEYFEDLSR
jgi:cysteinyl-tRNA synthetase, unknown class